MKGTARACALIACMALSPLGEGAESRSWDWNQIQKSHRVQVLPASPVEIREAPWVLASGHSIRLLDPVHLVPQAHHRFSAPLVGDPILAPDGRSAVLAFQDGWVMRWDLRHRKPVARVRVGRAIRDLVRSGDGRYLAVATKQPAALVLLDGADLSPRKRIPVDPGGILDLRAAPLRQSFIATLAERPEIWEMLLADDPLPVYNGPMHDYRMEEGIAKETDSFPIRRIRLRAPLEGFQLDPSNRLVIGTMAQVRRAQVIHLDVRHRIAEWDLGEAPDLKRAVFWSRKGQRILAVPQRETERIALFNLEREQIVREFSAPGPGCQLVARDPSPDLWIGACAGPRGDRIALLEKATLTPRAILRPIPGRSIAWMRFDHRGQRVLVHLPKSPSETVLVLYDGTTHRELERRHLAD